MQRYFKWIHLSPLEANFEEQYVNQVVWCGDLISKFLYRDLQKIDKELEKATAHKTTACVIKVQLLERIVLILF